MTLKNRFGLTLLLLSILACSNSDTIQKRPVLTENSILLNEQGVFVKDYDKVTSWSLYTTVANQNHKIDYSIYESEFNKYLIISEDKDSKSMIQLEYIGKKGPVDLTAFEEIEYRRNKWMQTCNDHQVELLIKEFYTNPPFYYNHKPLVTTQKDLLNEYSYMNEPDYNLKLSPMFTEAVNENLVFEIGQCSGSYNSKYVIVWKKESDGEWRIHLDSNI